MANNNTSNNIRKKETRMRTQGYESMHIAWHFNKMNDDAQWEGGKFQYNLTIIEEIKDRLNEYESKTWAEIKAMHHSHPMPPKKIIDKAKKRFEEITGDPGALNQLHQLEIKGGGGKQRLCGLRHQNIFKILWWDPEHKIYPTQQ